MRNHRRHYNLSTDKTRVTTTKLSDILPTFLDQVDLNVSQEPERLISAWPDVIGAHLAPMAQALSYYEGVLHVKVTNSTLYSLLSQQEKPRLLQVLRKRFPKTTLYDIRFRMG